jgi:flagellar export protein FliJ
MARRFVFRLDGLLRVREAFEREARRHFARMLRFREEAEAGLARLETEQTTTFESRRALPGVAIDLLRWRLVERYLVLLERRIAKAREDVELAKTQVDIARSSLLKARQAKLMLLRLKERRQAIHDLEASLKEGREMDDLAVLRSRFPVGVDAALSA